MIFQTETNFNAVLGIRYKRITGNTISIPLVKRLVTKFEPTVLTLALDRLEKVPAYKRSYSYYMGICNGVAKEKATASAARNTTTSHKLIKTFMQETDQPRLALTNPFGDEHECAV